MDFSSNDNIVIVKHRSRLPIEDVPEDHSNNAFGLFMSLPQQIQLYGTASLWSYNPPQDRGG